MTSYQKVLASLSQESTNAVDALLVALLTFASAVDDGSDVHSNPVDEVVRRLGVRGVNDIALSVIRPRLNTLREAYQSGSIK